MEEIIMSEVDLISKLPIHESNSFFKLLGARSSRSTAQSFTDETSHIEFIFEEFREYLIPGEFFEGCVRRGVRVSRNGGRSGSRGGGGGDSRERKEWWLTSAS